MVLPTTSILVAIVEKERRKEKNKRQKHRQAPTESIYILVPAQDPFPVQDHFPPGDDPADGRDPFPQAQGPDARPR